MNDQLKQLSLGEGFGIELEYMIVDQKTLDILPVADRLIELETGKIQNEVEDRDIGWSNELALHLVELKNLDPRFPFHQLGHSFQQEIRKMNRHLESSLGGMLLSSAMHPWMKPENESRIWPHGHRQIYEEYDRVFGCRGHGWTNLQSTHLNFSFSSTEEFRRLHRAIRLILPLIPALSASSPFWEGVRGPALDTRLHVYLNNQKRIPEIIGPVIPEDVVSMDDYQRLILAPMYKAISPFDPEGILRHEWLNSRAAIAKFAYGCVEVRLMDVQECPQQDLSLAWFFRRLVEELVKETWTLETEQGTVSESELRALLEISIFDGIQSIYRAPFWMKQWGLKTTHAVSARQLVEDLLSRLKVDQKDQKYLNALNEILKQGTLAERLVRGVGKNVSRESLQAIYRELAKNLETGKVFCVK